MAIKLKIGLDIDDVCVDFISAFRKEAEIVLGRKLPEPPINWECSNWWQDSTERSKVWKQILSTPEWFIRRCGAMPGAIEGIKQLQIAGHQITFITARPSTAGGDARAEGINSLKLLGIHNPQVIVARNKGPIVRALELDLFVDDKPDNLRDIESCTNGHTRCVVFDQLHNQGSCPSRWVRVSNWVGLLNYIKSIT